MQQILVIDDSKPIQKLIAAVLADEGVATTAAYDASQGSIRAASLIPDLILLDIEMPGINGFEACRRLKADPVTAGIPIVFLTSVSSVDEKVRGLSLGAVDYITKPVNSAELLARVRASLRTSRLVRLLEKKAMIDFLTGLGNRAMFEERLQAEVSLRTRQGNPLSCIAVELDQFKSITNDHGYPFGEQMLLKVAQTISDLCRAEDVACRMGAEEFLILSPNTNSVNAASLAERIRKAVAEITFTQYGDTIHITCSVGVAEANDIFDRSMAQRATDALSEIRQPARHAISVTAGSESVAA